MCASAADATATAGETVIGLSAAPRPTPGTGIGPCSGRAMSAALKKALFADADPSASTKAVSGPTPGAK